MPDPQSLTGRLTSKGRLLVKEVGAFGIVGGVAFLVDVGLLQLLYGHLGVGAVTAKVLSTLVAMTLAYFAHRHWSFSHRARTGVRREYLLFALINGCTLLIGAAVVWFVRYPLGQDSVLAIQAANVGSIVMTTLIRYFAYRVWVFPAHDAASADEPLPEEASPQARIVA